MLSYMFSFFGIIMIHLTLFEIIQWISNHSEVWVLIKPRFILPLVKNLTDSEVENKPDSEPLVYFDEKEPTEPITEPDRVKPIWKPRPPSNFDQAPITNDADLDESSYSETYESEMNMKNMEMLQLKHQMMRKMFSFLTTLRRLKFTTEWQQLQF